jgi:hypothetical protein
LEAEIRKVTEQLQRFRKFARDRGFTEPTVTSVELREYAQDGTAFRRWAQEVKESFEEEAEESSEDSD